jgi:hypothetical protein
MIALGLLGLSCVSVGARCGSVGLPQASVPQAHASHLPLRSAWQRSLNANQEAVVLVVAL